MSDTHKLQKLIDNLERRDSNDSWAGSDHTIEERIRLADNRASNALNAVVALANYIMERERTGGGNG